MKNLGFLVIFTAIVLLFSCGKSDDALAPELSSAFASDKAFSASASSSSSNSTSGGNAIAEGVVDQTNLEFLIERIHRLSFIILIFSQIKYCSFLTNFGIKRIGF